LLPLVSCIQCLICGKLTRSSDSHLLSRFHWQQVHYMHPQLGDERSPQITIHTHTHTHRSHKADSHTNIPLYHLTVLSPLEDEHSRIWITYFLIPTPRSLSQRSDHW
jgi:hypothetical protein